MNRRILPLKEVTRLLVSSPRGRRVLRLLDPASESGLETLARLSLRGRGIRIRSQVQVAKIGRVDLLIGDRLVLELDGESFHGDFERDRARDRALIALGYVVMRITYRQLLEEWEVVERQILDVVRRREHLWRGPHAKLGHQVRGYRRAKSDGKR